MRRFNLIANLVRSVFALSIAGMIWWAFVWPVVVSFDSSDPIIETGLMLSLALFLISMTALVVFRQRGERNSSPVGDFPDRKG